MNHSPHTRTALAITLSVWKALFLREALSRLFASRAAWFWLLLEPVFHVAFLTFFFTVIRVRTMGGIDTVLWVIIGMLAFFFFRRTGTQVISAVGANRALFAYRQVKPIDTTLVRGGLEGMLMIVITGILLAGIALLDHSVVPAEPLSVLLALLGLWLFGLGFGLMGSVAVELVPEFGKLIKLSMMPLYLISGVIFPISSVPQPYQDWLMYNPVAHGLEAARLGFAAHYHAVAQLSLEYLYSFALVCLFMGLALHRRFALRLTTL